MTPDGSGRAQLRDHVSPRWRAGISVRYLGNGTDAASAPAALVQTVTAANTALTVRVTPLVVAPGGTVTVAVAASAVRAGQRDSGGRVLGVRRHDAREDRLARGHHRQGAERVGQAARGHAAAHGITVVTAGTAKLHTGAVVARHRDGEEEVVTFLCVV